MSDPISEVAFSQPKLPAIGDSRSLVSQPTITTSSGLSDVSDQERLNTSRPKSSVDLDNGDVQILLQQVSRSFVNALQLNTKQSWYHLCEVLDIIEPYSHFLSGTPQIRHYVDRVYVKIKASGDENDYGFVEKKLLAVFPDELSVSLGGTRQQAFSFPTEPSVDSLFTPRGQQPSLYKGVKVPRGVPIFPGGTTYIFDHSDRDAKSHGPKPLCMEDLKRALPGVVREIAIREATLGGSLGTTALALDIDLPQTHVPTPPSIPRGSPSSPVIRIPLPESGRVTQQSDIKRGMLGKTGREVVENFVKGRFLGQENFAFLNVAPSVRYDPYNLVVVPEDKVNPEHYVISSHCVLHVNPNGPSETQSLAEWYREACLFKAISNIGFFKNFVVTKMFRKWKDIKKFSQFLKVEAEIEKSLISNVPSFGSALIRISSLLQDLEKVTFLPFQINFSYSLEEFEDTIFKTCGTGYKYMEKFFSYCQMIVDKTQESCFEYLEYCEGQVKNHRHNYQESLAVAKKKRAVRQHNLKLARDEVKRLGTFVCLVDHIIVSNLLKLVQRNISRFVDEAMPGPRPERDGLFSAEIVFGDDHKLTLSPSVKQFSHAVSVAVGSVISASCNLSHAMELGSKAKHFQEKAENGMHEQVDCSEPNDFQFSDSMKQTKTGDRPSDIDKLIYGTDKQSETLLTGEQQPMSTNTTAHLQTLQRDDQGDVLEILGSPTTVTRTDDEIYEDLDGLNSDLSSAREMSRQATLQLCFRQEPDGGLLVEGQRFQDFLIDRSPLTKEKLMEIIHKNKQITEAFQRQADLLSQATEEVEQFCDDHSWVAVIHEFVSSWGSGDTHKLRGQQTSKIEQQLNQIKTWKEQVFSMAKSFCTQNGIFFVDCHKVQEVLLPQLNTIFKEMMQLIITDVITFSDEVIKDVDKLSELLKDQKTDIKGFSDFIQKLSTVKKHVLSLKEKVECIKNLYEVIRSCYRQLTPEEEMMEEKVWATWESFLFGLQEASDFVEVHKPQVSAKLIEIISALQCSAEEIGQTATTGKFLDPNEKPSSILQDMRELKEKFVGIRDKLAELSKCQAIMLGSEYDLGHITGILLAMEKRQELWKYCDSSSYTIREWMQTVFKKMNVKKAMDKLSEWANAGEKLRNYLPENDEVLVSWLSQLEEFSQDLPFLLQLSSDALKPRHWRALFIGMGQDYDPSWEFTVANLLSFNLGHYKDLITTVCAGAAAEYALELQLYHLARAWEEKDFKLAKHIPLLRPRLGGWQKGGAKGKRKTRQTGAEKANVKVKPKTPASVPDMYILIGIGELKCIIEDNLVTLHIMLTSPHVADLKSMVETWITNLQEIESITDIWADCQKKWLYLSNVFAEPELRKSLENSSQSYLKVDENYREFVQVILRDPKVLSVLPLKKRGEKGWRDLQGDTLREQLLELTRKEEELIKMVGEYIDKARVIFPRLYFLSDNDLLGLLAWSRNPKDLLPFVRKCFPGIKNLQFALPRDGNLRLASTLDTALNAHLLQVTAMEGVLEEVVPLLSVIPASPRPQSWLVTLEEKMRNTLVKSLAECVDIRLSERLSPSKLLESITSFGEKVFLQSSNTASDSKQTSKEEQRDSSQADHVYLKFPSQCVVTAEAVLWNKEMTEVLQNKSLRGLSNLRKSLVSYVDELSQTIRKNLENESRVSAHNRLELLLSALVGLVINQRDIVTEFVNNGVLDVNSFEWSSQLQHHIELKKIITSRYQGEDSGENQILAGSSTIPVEHLYEIGLCSLHQLGTNFAYGYEYLGPTPRLVVTPLTQRCFLTLTMALRSHQCGVPVGPDGIGKTETIKDLAKALGRHLVVFNCSEQPTTSMFVRYLFGMVRSGSWACFENVDCVEPGILSFLGEHLASIRTSMKALERIVISQYTARGISKTDNLESETVKRRNSVTTLGSLPQEAFSSCYRSESKSGSHVAKRKRHLSISKICDLEEGDYFENETPQPLSPLEQQPKFPPTFHNKVAKVYKKQTSLREFEMPLLGNIVFEGQLMAASAMYGCFMTMSGKNCFNADLPENFRAQLRPISMVFPDYLPVVEVWLVCCGFTEAKSLAMKINTFFKLINEQVSSQPQYSFGLRSMKMVTTLAATELQKEMTRKRRPTISSITEESPSENAERKTRSPFLETLERRQAEENAIVHALFSYFGKKLLGKDKDLFSRGVDEVFAHSVLMSVSTEGDSKLVEEVKDHLQTNGLQVKQELVSKIIQLHTTLQTSRNVILLGCPGSGKSTIYTTLASALNSMNGQTTQPVVKHRRQAGSERRVSTSFRPAAKVPVEEIKDVQWPRVDLSIVFPKSLTCEELFGRQHPETDLWMDGLVSKWLRDTTLTCDTMTELLSSQSSEKQRIARMMGSLSHVKKWLVLDGPMDDTWLESMGTLLDSTRALSLPNGESIAQPETVTLLFEVTEIIHVSPALVTRCGLLYCPQSLVGWKPIFRSWLKGAHTRWEITNRGLGIISCLMDHVVDSTLYFLSHHCESILTSGYSSINKPSKTATGVHEVQSLLRYLSAIYDRHILREDEDSQIQMINQRNRQTSVSSGSSRHSSGISASDTGRVISSFAFAFIWAFGGHLHERCADKFDEHTRQLLSAGPYPVLIPPDGSVYDYCLDFSKGGLVKWEGRPGSQLKTLPSSYTVVTELDRYFYLIDLMLSAHQPLLLVGPSGIGKSSLVQNLINPRYNSTRICLSAGLTSKLLQEAIEHKLQQIQRKEMTQLAFTKAIPGAAAPKNLPVAKSRAHLMFLDDLNYAASDDFGIQPPLELLRQILSQGTLYNKQRHHLYRVQHLQFMAACVPPGAASSCGGVASYAISHRLSRLMTVLSFFPLSSESVENIYSSVFQTWLEEFPAYSISHHEHLAKALSSASIKMHNTIQRELRPTPLHPHFLFTQHELSRVAQGMSLLSSKSRGRPRPRVRRRAGTGNDLEGEAKAEAIGDVKSESSIHGKERSQRRGNVGRGRSWPSLTNGPVESGMSAKTPAALSPMICSLLRLWCHESTRTYSDRLLTEEQRYWFSSLLHETVEEFFCKTASDLGSEVFSVERSVMQNSQEALPGRNAPPPTTSDEQIQTTGESEALLQSDDSLAVPGREPQDLSDEDAGEEGDIDAIPTQETPEPGEDFDEIVADTTEKDVTNREIRPEKQNGNDENLGEGEVPEDETLSREQSLIANTVVHPPARVKVTFDDTSGASYDKNYNGPLISSEQLAFSGEDLTDIVFCKHFNVSVTGRESSASEVASKNYLECAESILEQGIKRCLVSYNDKVAESSNAKIMNLVTFREALHHAARLSRALATPGGHSLLLSDLGYGRRTLTRLTAHAACCKLIELQRSQFQNQEDFRQQIKVASFIAGLQAKPVVLFVPEGVDDEAMQDICSLMAEGTCPGLYTHNELFMISNQLLPGGKRGARRVENQDIAQDRYFRRVKSHIHVVVCLKYKKLDLSNSLEKNQLYKFPSLVKRSCCVDVYRAWPHEALVSVAEKLLDEEESVLSLVPLKRRERDLQSVAICSIMAHVHLSSRSMAERIYGVKALKFYSPDTYLDFVDLFRKICRRLCAKEKEVVAHLDKAIKRVEEATHSLSKMQKELNSLAPVFEASKTDVQLRQETVEACQKEYSAAMERCKKQEKDIEDMQIPIELLRKEAQAEFEKVNPLFDAAWKAIDSLNIHDLEEIRSYRTPPALVTLVVNAICLMFEKEQTWEEGKLLLNRNNFFKDLEFYNMAEMRDSIFEGLKTFYYNPLFQADVVQDGSMAARSLCLWVRAVYDFCLVNRSLKPKRQQLEKAEQELEKAKSILGEMRVRCNAIKQELESNIQRYKESVKHSRTVEKQIQNIETIKSKGDALVDSLSSYSNIWHSGRLLAQQHLTSAPGDSLVTAAAVCYLGPLIPEARDELFADWLRVCDGVSRAPRQGFLTLSSVSLADSRKECKYDDGDTGRDSRPATQSTLVSTITTNIVPVREDVSLKAILAAPNELEDWRRNDLPTNEQAVNNALILRSCGDDRTRAWPLLIDPHNQAELWIRALHQDEAVDRAPSSRPDTRQSGRSSRLSGGSSVDMEAFPTLHYPHLQQASEEEFEADPQHFDSEVDQFLQSLRENDDQESRFPETETQATSRTERTAGSALTSASDKMLKEKLAEAMGIQIDSSPLPIPPATSPVLTLSEGRILVVSADDPLLVEKLQAAVKKGLATLVTHVERRRWNKALELLLTRQTFTNTEGNLQVIIGKTVVDYSPSFRLYLSSTLPLFIPGEGQCPLPFSKACTINMSVSREGICDALLADTLQLERPEFDGQMRSIDRDIGLHKQQINNAKENILEKVLNLSGPLLKDSAMLDAVTQSKDLISMAEDRCREAEVMKTDLLAKQNDFLPVAQHGALLFSVINELRELHPYYRFPLELFIQLFRDTVVERNRGKKGSGSPAARAAELITALSRKIFDRTSWSLFQSDNHVFAFLLAAEKLMNSKSVSRDEWQLFTEVSRRSELDHPEESEVLKPSWITHKVWESVGDLERLPVFIGLKQSVAEHSHQWQEYFNLPPVLLSVTPGDYNHLTIFQKALLWKTFKRDQLFHVCQEIVLYQMGANMIRPLGYDLSQVCDVINRSRPAVLMLPSQNILEQGEATVLKDPVTDVVNLARARGKDTPLLKVTFGEKDGMEKALKAVKRGLNTGCWVILENCHLAACWSDELMHEIEEMVNLPVIDTEGDLEWHNIENNSDANAENGSAEDVFVHPEFRLWLTTRTDIGFPLPAVIIHRGLKLACEAQESFGNAVRTNCQVATGSLNNGVPLWGEAAKGSVFMSDVPPGAIFTLAYLHTLLLQRRKFGNYSFSCPYQWSQVDLLAGLEALRHLSRASHGSLPLAAVEVMLGYTAYGGHVTNGLDLDAVRSLANSVATEKLKMNSVQETSTYEQIEKYVEDLPEALSCQQLGLSDVCSLAYQSKLSSALAERLALSARYQPTALSIETHVKSVAEETLNKLTNILDLIKSHDLASKETTAIGSFIQRELLYFQNLYESTSREIELFINACSGHVAFTPDLYNIALSLGRYAAPSKWLLGSTRDMSLAEWLEALESQVKALCSYSLPSSLHPSSYWLGAFAHPQAFLACVLMAHARSAMKSVYVLEFSVEIMDPNFSPTSPPDRGIFLRDLKLSGASWEGGRGCIIEAPESRDICDLPIVWLKPVEVIRSRAPSAKVEKLQSDLPFFNCPLFVGKSWGEDASALVTSLPLPTAVPEELLKQRRMAIVSHTC